MNVSGFVPGMVSVSFRPLEPRRIVELVARAELRAIEWGGDVHVPPGDAARAREVSRMTRDAGLGVAAYGSYVRLGEDDPATFAGVIETARELGAPAVRVWAGRKGSKDADAAYRVRVVEHALKMAELAQPLGMKVCYEYHADTLTDADASAGELLRKTEHPAIRTLWQPPHGMTVEERCESLRSVLPRLQHVHVFYWPGRKARAPLAEGAEGWLRYLRILRDAGRACPLLLEFVRGDDPEQLIADAKTLHALIGRARTEP